MRLHKIGSALIFSALPACVSTTDVIPNTGSMYEYSAQNGGLDGIYSSSSEDQWLHFITESNIHVIAGDIFEVTVKIHNNSIIGSENIALLAFHGNFEGTPCSYPWFNGDPCSTVIEVVEFNLEQSIL